MSKNTRLLSDFAYELRVLRKAKKMTGVELGRQVGVSQSRISKIEGGVVKPSIAELKAILNILNCPETIRQQIIAKLEITSSAFHPKHRPIMAPNFSELYKTEAQTRHQRSFMFNIMPALLQTGGYREALLGQWELSPKEVAQRVGESLKRQDLLWSGERTYHFILQEAALYTVLNSKQVQLEQLDRLERLSTLKHIRIGIIPTKAGLTATENTNFVLYDTRMLTQVSPGQELTYDDPQTIAEHLKVFAELDQKALYGTGARELIREAANFFEP